jgi:hypothetical protein
MHVVSQDFSTRRFHGGSLDTPAQVNPDSTGELNDAGKNWEKKIGYYRRWIFFKHIRWEN